MATMTSIDSARASRFKAFVRRNPLGSMYGLMFLLAWPILILEALGSHGWVPKPPALLGFATGWAPGVGQGPAGHRADSHCLVGGAGMVCSPPGAAAPNH